MIMLTCNNFILTRKQMLTKKKTRKMKRQKKRKMTKRRMIKERQIVQRMTAKIKLTIRYSTFIRFHEDHMYKVFVLIVKGSSNLRQIKGSVTVGYIFVYCRFIGLFAKNQ